MYAQRSTEKLTTSGAVSASSFGRNSSSSITSRSRWLYRRYGKISAFAALAALLTLCWRVQIFFSATQCFHGSAHCQHAPGQPLFSDGLHEMVDTLAHFKHQGPKCNVSSRQLHRAASSPCPDRASLIYAMASGGRIGKDAPYVSRGCDFVWFDTGQICDILNRFSQVILVGDSMLRHVIGAINILIREDLGYGGVTNWNFNPDER